jgi:hypothetical protein
MSFEGWEKEDVRGRGLRWRARFRIVTLSKLLLLLILACLAQADDTLTVSEYQGEIVIRSHGQEWTIPLSKLPVRRVDCQDRCGTLRGCTPPCIWGASVFLFDEQRQDVYLATPTGISQNMPWIMWRYSLRTKTVRRLTNEWGGGFATVGAVSPSGRYLAYVFGPHVGAVCAPQSYIGIVDLQEQRVAKTGSVRVLKGKSVQITAVKWTSGSELAYEANVVTGETCGLNVNEPTQTSGTVDIKKVKFE